jgi:hypothetical protein
MYFFGSEQVRISGQMRSSKGVSPLDGTGHEVDVAVIRLDPVPTLSKPTLLINHLGGHIRPLGGEELVITGYPASKTHVRKRYGEVRAIAYVNSGTAIAPCRLSEAGINPRFRLAMDFHTRKVIGVGGKRQMAPHPMGMSGAPIWIVNQVGERSFKIGVIGIMTDYLADHKMLVGTTIAAAVGVIAEFSETRSIVDNSS